MDLRLYEAARSGDTSSLHALITVDPLILERGSLDCNAETCLHIAALAGSLNFVKEIMSFKPDLATRVNRDGFSPIHMASANGYAEIVKELLTSNIELGRQKSTDGRTALHFATITGQIDVLKLLINRVPECMVDLTDQDESALHVALKNSQIEAFRILWERLKEINTEEMKRIVNAKDQDGNTILHIAVSKKQLRVVKLLLVQEGNDSVLKVEVNSNNKNGYTAMDMLFQPRRAAGDPIDHRIQEILLQASPIHHRIQEILHQARAHRSQDIIVPLTSPVATYQPMNVQVPVNNQSENMCFNPSKLWKFIVKEISSLFIWEIWSTSIQEIEKSTPEMRNALMVVAVLIATITYQSVLSPPGGYRQFNAAEDPDPVHSDGIAIIASDALVFVFVIFFSSIGFFLSVVMILMLTSQFPLKLFLRLAVLATSVDFICTVLYIAPIDFSIIYIVTMIMFALVLLHFLYFILWILRLTGRKQAQA